MTFDEGHLLGLLPHSREGETLASALGPCGKGQREVAACVGHRLSIPCSDDHPIEGTTIPLDDDARDGEGRRLLSGLCGSKRRKSDPSTKCQARQEGQQELGLRHI